MDKVLVTIQDTLVRIWTWIEAFDDLISIGCVKERKCTKEGDGDAPKVQ